MSILGAIISTHQSQLLRTQMNEFGQSVLMQTASTAVEPVLSKDELSLSILVKNIAESNNVMGVSIFDHDMKLIVSTGVSPTKDLPTIYSQGNSISDNIVTIDWNYFDKDQKFNVTSFVTPIAFKKLTAGYALVTFSHYSMYEASNGAIQVIGIATVLIILITALFIFSLSRHLTRPIQELVLATQNMVNGKFQPDLNDRRNDELGHLIQAFNKMTQGLIEKNQVEQVFSQFVSESVAQKMLSDLNAIELGGARVEASVVFADIVGFTKMSENMPPEDVAHLLNFYFSHISKACSLYRGTIDKYMGDCAMAIYGVPNDDAEHRFHAIAGAIMLNKLIERLNSIRASQGKTTVTFRIGINSGTMLAGNLGAEDRMQYTVVGDSVNLASRLASVAGSNEIVITEQLFNHPDVRGRVIARQHESIRLRGISEPVTTYLVEDIVSTYRSIMDQNINKIIKNLPPEEVNIDENLIHSPRSGTL